MTERLFGEILYDRGYRDLVSVIPPGAQLTPSSKIATASIGKAPGRRLGTGLWAGYDWRKSQPTIEDVRNWGIQGASLGLRADRFPGVDIDCTDAGLCKIIEDFAIRKLGPAPKRVGRAPKALLMYRTDEPFSRMRLWITIQGTAHMVEVLGMGQQYLVHGVHPATARPYEWTWPVYGLLGNEIATGTVGFPPPEVLTPITRDQADMFLVELADLLGDFGVVEREGDGRIVQRAAVVDQTGLVAPDITTLRAAVAAIPNLDTVFSSREDYIKFGYAIRAACGDEHEEGFAIFADWAARWDGGVNAPDTVRQDWRRMRAPFAVGWNWIAEHARRFGYETASLDFEVADDGAAPIRSEAIDAPLYSDQWLAKAVVAARRGELRYVPQTGRFLVWHKGRWAVDAELLGEDIVKQELRAIGGALYQRAGGSAAEKKAIEGQAKDICSAYRASAVATLVKSEREIAIGIDQLDRDPWVLNTPDGIVNLKSGVLGPADPDALCSRCTIVRPLTEQPVLWLRFLHEATGGDEALIGYLWRLCGYALTGSTREQQLTFIHGKGGNGKGVFLHTVAAILGDYARNASMEAFTASNNERHSTEIAMLAGARLVTASETQAGKRWDEAKVKGLTGGDPVTARFMRQDNFTFMPQFKLIFIGNHRPEIRDVDAAMRRRMHLVPFTNEPAHKDLELTQKLVAEYPAILAWMIRGCLEWQQHGLNPPASVRAATEEYFSEEDAVGRWLSETCEQTDHTELSQDLFLSWKQWANASGEYVGTLKRLSSALSARKVERWRDPATGRMGFRGLRIKDRQGFGVV